MKKKESMVIDDISETAVANIKRTFGENIPQPPSFITW
jgi:hypothetical protein